MVDPERVRKTSHASRRPDDIFHRHVSMLIISTSAVKRNVENTNSQACGTCQLPEMAGDKTLGARLRTLRLLAGETQVETAVAIDIERSTYTGIERGLAMPSRAVLLSLARHFRVSAESLTCAAPAAPGIREIVEDPKEIALLRLWRAMDPFYKARIAAFLAPPGVSPSIDSDDLSHAPPPTLKPRDAGDIVRHPSRPRPRQKRA